MVMSRRVAMTFACVGSVIVGIVAGAILQVETYRLMDNWLPHPDGHGFDENLYRGIQGAFAMYPPALAGAVCGQFLSVPFALSFFLPLRLGARVCGVVACCIGIATGVALLVNLLGLFPQGVMLEAKHGLLMYFSFPVLCIGPLMLRAAFLAMKGVSSER